MRNIIKNAFIMHYKKRWEIYRALSIFLLVTLISTFVNMTLINVKADNSIGDKPSFEIQIDEAKPNPALVGEDILIKGKIIPKPFEMEMERQKKEIILVLDTSGSMDEKVGKVCTNKRVRYKVEGHWEYRGIFKQWVDTYYINDYCEEHGKVGQHYASYSKSTKMEELKKAANNFIDKMKDVPDLKIGIVSYSTNANIDIDEFSNNSNKLHRIIDNLNAGGGTNTGEGLRKAEYMLEQGDKDTKKTIVFMSDGLPTFYSVYKNHQNVQKYYWVLKCSWDKGCRWEKEYYWEDEYYWDDYTSIDDTFPNYAGTGNSDDQGYCKKYAKKIGEIIKNNKSNVFSLGYGLGDKNSDANKIMKEIHESMGGTEKDFFATDTGAIDEIFSQIADKIKESYTIDNLEMDMNLKSEDGFTLKVGVNTVKLNNVIYKKVSENNGKIRYEADAVPFEFVIKGSKVGEYENLFKDSKGKFSWKGNDISIPITTPDNFITKIKANELPYIQVKLISGENINSKNINEEIEVKYEITTKPFKYNVDSSLTVSDAQLNFDFGNNFKIIEAGNLEKINESENKYKVKLNEIQYELQKEGENQGEWVQIKPIEIKFKIKKSLNSGYGKLEFGEKKNNTILYTNFNGESTINSINTPIVNFEGSDLRHGIYNGLNDDGTVNINTTIKSYPKDSRINFGAYFKYSGKSQATLNISEECEVGIDEPINIYKINRNNELQLLNTIQVSSSKSYSINLSELGLTSGDNVLIVYNEKIIVSGETQLPKTFVNTIKLDDSNPVNASVNITNLKMPELY